MTAAAAAVENELGTPQILMVGTGNTAYSASKGDIVGLTHELAIGWAPCGVRVNALAPAWFDTPMGQRGRERRGVDYYASRVPMGRIGELWEIVGPAVFLASDGSSTVTGHTLAVDGGFLSW